MDDSPLSGAPAVPLIADPQTARLWERVQNFSFDQGNGPRTFAGRLAGEQGWSVEFTARAIGEYRRFLLLFALGEQREANVPPGVSPVRVVPSAVVDKVWHLHLLYTQSYWGTLCRDTLGMDLHHQPANGSGGESVSLDAVYLANMRAYRATFGEDAPADIWPASGTMQPLLPRRSEVPVAPVSQPADRSFAARHASTVLLFVGGLGLLAVLYLNATGNPAAATDLMDALLVGLGTVTVASLFIKAIAAPSASTGGFRVSASRRRSYAGGMELSTVNGGCGGVGSGDGAESQTASHSSHVGTHDGGHAHSCGGSSHSCGGHSCGGHGCGGH